MKNAESYKKAETLAADWYTWMMTNKPDHFKTGRVIATDAAPTSNKYDMVQLTIEGEDGQAYNINMTIEKWFVKGLSRGKDYKFGKHLINRLSSTEV